MCGIAGVLYSGPAGDHAARSLQDMTQKIRHRGPDSDGAWLDHDAGIALGHRRLAIVDVSPAGAQPMCSPSGRFVIAFNGEIYNHIAMRAELARSGFLPAWRGQSDTETLVAAFDAWGIEASIKKSVGMFAIAAWDRQERVLILVRDRLGEKPLYYGWQGAGSESAFLFGSELKALRAHPSFSAPISRDALALYMRHGSVPGALSIYAGIHKLEPGCLLTVSREAPEPGITRFWSGADVAVQGVASPFSGTADEAVDALALVLRDAVAQQMIADVPLGAFLSGGVDSSTVVALMQAQSARRVKTFSIGFEQAAYNEAIYAKQVAAHLGTEHVELYVSSRRAMEVIPRLPALYDEPFADSSQIPTFLVSQLARKEISVALSGDAGDELFGGYNRYQITASSWERLSRLPRGLRKAMAWSILSIRPDEWDAMAHRMPFLKRWSGFGDKLHKGASVLGAESNSALYLGLVSQWQDPTLVVLDSTEPETLLSGLQPDFTGLNSVERMMALDMLTYLPDDILTKVDRAAMGVSLETRVPFLDHRVVEFAWRLPLDYKLRRESSRLTTKWALRQVLYRHVPRDIIDRPKMGFGVPIDAWLRGPLRAWAEDLLGEARIRREGFLDPAPIRQKWHEHLSGRRNWQPQLWCVLMFQAWLAEQQS